MLVKRSTERRLLMETAMFDMSSVEWTSSVRAIPQSTGRRRVISRADHLTSATVRRRGTFPSRRLAFVKNCELTQAVLCVRMAVDVFLLRRTKRDAGIRPTVRRWPISALRQVEGEKPMSCIHSHARTHASTHTLTHVRMRMRAERERERERWREFLSAADVV